MAHHPFAKTRSSMRSFNAIGALVGLEGWSNVCCPRDPAGATDPILPPAAGIDGDIAVTCRGSRLRCQRGGRSTAAQNFQQGAATSTLHVAEYVL
jgi:hypothetical protein